MKFSVTQLGKHECDSMGKGLARAPLQYPRDLPSEPIAQLCQGLGLSPYLCWLLYLRLCTEKGGINLLAEDSQSLQPRRTRAVTDSHMGRTAAHSATPSFVYLRSSAVYGMNIMFFPY